MRVAAAGVGAEVGEVEVAGAAVTYISRPIPRN